jgi:hypothetical protein
LNEIPIQCPWESVGVGFLDISAVDPKKGAVDPKKGQDWLMNKL